jgi:PqqD family protein of HPr-rel-A system
MSDSDLWTRQADDRLTWRNWGEAFFVFHPASGQTHFLNEIAAFAVRRLADGPLSTAQICAATCDAYEIEDGPDLRDAIAETLVSLDMLGLVERMRTA